MKKNNIRRHTCRAKILTKSYYSFFVFKYIIKCFPVSVINIIITGSTCDAYYLFFFFFTYTTTCPYTSCEAFFYNKNFNWQLIH